MGMHRPVDGILAAVTAVVLATSVVACGSTPPAPSGPVTGLTPSAAVAPTPSTGAASGSPGTVSPAPAASPQLTSSPLPAPGKALASSGSIVARSNEGALWLVDAAGTRTLIASADGGPFSFPAWSPDGTRIAAIRYGTDGNSLLVFDATAIAGGGSADPVVLLESSSIAPFYLSWSPDGAQVSYLANDTDGLSLRLAPADGSAPVDGSGAGSTVGTGNPFYYDWIGDDRLIAHVGTGPEAVLNEIGLDGGAAGPPLGPPGSFRSAVVSPDETALGFIRQNADGTSDVVVAPRDGSGERAIPIGGFGAIGFDPSGDRLAAIGPVEPVEPPLGFPLGPLRLLDRATGEERTLLDGSVIAFWWSPDGTTVAALRLQPIDSPNADPSAQERELRMFFLDAASGDTRSSVAVIPGRLFLDQVFPFFDQYALSHELWAPDSSSFLLPIADRERLAVLTVLYPGGEEPETIEGAVGFWSPQA
jgi:TolB protein